MFYKVEILNIFLIITLRTLIDKTHFTTAAIIMLCANLTGISLITEDSKKVYIEIWRWSIKYCVS